MVDISYKHINRTLLSKIKRDKIGFFLFCFMYALLIFFIYGIQDINDFDENSYLNYRLYICNISCLFSVWTHFKCFLTNPGIINHETNPQMVDFYLTVREFSLRRGVIFNEKIGKKAFAEFREAVNSDEDTDFDDTEYPAVTSIQDEMIDNMKVSNYNINFKRCFRCFVVRFPGVKHCSRCQGCIINMDHHCPWIFNCIGQFNQKFFLQFIGYSYIFISEVVILSFYYVFIKDKKL